MRRSKYFPGKEGLQSILGLLILLIPLLIIAPGWDGFVYSPTSLYSDITISHYPNAQFFLDSLRQGQFPFWSPTILAGYPFAADPLAGVWYVPGWLALLFPLPFGLNLMVLVHLFFSGLGMLLFLRALGYERLPSLAGALAWELTPKLFAHFGAGHLSLVYAAAWTPWLLLAEKTLRGHRFSFASGIILGVIALADIRWAAYAGVLWLGFSLWQQFPEFPAMKQFLLWRKWLLGLLVKLLLTFMVAAPLLLPLLEYTRLSTRYSMQVQDNMVYAISPVQLLGLVAPNFQSYAEWTIYIGGAAVIALLWTLTHPALRRKAGFWLWMMLVALLLSLGPSFPLNFLLARLPGFDLLRVPSRFLLVFDLSAAVVLAQFIQSVSRQAGNDKEGHFWGNLLTFGVTIFTWIIVVALWAIEKNLPWIFLWGATALTSSLVLLMGRNRGGFSPTAYLTGMVILLVLDLAGVSQSDFIYRSKVEVLGERQNVALQVRGNPDLFRIFSPSYSIPQQTAFIFGLQTVNGIDPLQLSNFVSFAAAASGIPDQNYSVTVPPFEKGDPAMDNASAIPNSQMLGLLNVAYVVSEFPISANGLSLQGTLDHAYIYRNERVRPRIWIQADTTESSDLLDQATAITSYSPNRISIHAEGPGILVLSEINYPGWQVQVDGQAVEGLTIDGLLRGVRLAPGSHQVIFSFRPDSIYAGLALAVLAWFWAFYQIIWVRI